MRLIVFLTDPPTIRAILAHLGEPTTLPRAHAPPDVDAGFAFDFDQSPRGGPTAPSPDRGFTFDQTTA